MEHQHIKAATWRNHVHLFPRMSIWQLNLKGNKLVTRVLNIAVNIVLRTRRDDSLYHITTFAHKAFSCVGEICHLSPQRRGSSFCKRRLFPKNPPLLDVLLSEMTEIKCDGHISICESLQNGKLNVEK